MKAKEHIAFDYAPSDVRVAIQSAFNSDNIGAEYVNRHDTNNMSASSGRRVTPQGDALKDIMHAIEHLNTIRELGKRNPKVLIHGYNTKSIDCGVLLYSKEGLAALRRHGALVLMDSTHKTNKWRWRLFTLTVRDKYGSYLPAAQFLIDREIGDNVADALRVLQELEPGWSPLYFVTDDSQIEQNGIDDAFPAPYTPRVFLCTVHTMRTWRRKIYNKHLITLLITALHKTTEAGCDLALKRALEYARTLPQPPPRPEGLDRAGNLRPEKASVHPAVYLDNTVIPKKHRWALYMRSMTPALLQLATTNAAESYHRLLKRGRGRGGICNWGVAALFRHVVRVNLKRFKDAKIAMELSNTKKVTITKEYPGLEKLPYNVQRLLAGQAHAADVR